MYPIMGWFKIISKLFFNLFSGGKKSVPLPPRGRYGVLNFTYKGTYGLDYKIEERAVRKQNKLLKAFYERNKRLPNRYELGGMIINASHLTMKYRRGNSGHWERQKVRNYLFNLYGIPYRKR